MPSEDLKELNPADLQAKSTEIREDIFRLRVRRGMGQLENPMAIRTRRRELARVMTALTVAQRTNDNES